MLFSACLVCGFRNEARYESDTWCLFKGDGLRKPDKRAGYMDHKDEDHINIILSFALTN